MPTRLSRPPTFTTVRSAAGAVAADPAVINDVNYPLTSAVEPAAPTDQLAVYWYASGGTQGQFDSLDLQILERDVKYGTTGRWVEGEIHQGVRAEEAVFFSPRSTQFYVRVLSASSPAGTGLVIRAASAL